MSDIKEIKISVSLENGDVIQSEIKDSLIKAVLSSLHEKGENPAQVLEYLCRIGFENPQTKEMLISSIVANWGSRAPLNDFKEMQSPEELGLRTAEPKNDNQNETLLESIARVTGIKHHIQ